VLRNAPQPEVAVASAEVYEATLAAQSISLHLHKRSEAIWAAVAAEAAAVGGAIPDSARADLLQEVANLVESPTVVRWAAAPAALALADAGGGGGGAVVAVVGRCRWRTGAFVHPANTPLGQVCTWHLLRRPLYTRAQPRLT
jgi:hypothetical protein